MAGASGRKLDETKTLAWIRGLKTTFNLRTLAAATDAEKSTGCGGELNAVPINGSAVASSDAVDATKFCRINNLECEACQ